MAKKARKLPPKTIVNLRVIGAKGKEKKFEIGLALKILNLPNSQWELHDQDFIFEGHDIKRKPSKKADSSATE